MIIIICDCKKCRPIGGNVDWRGTLSVRQAVNLGKGLRCLRLPYGNVYRRALKTAPIK